MTMLRRPYLDFRGSNWVLSGIRPFSASLRIFPKKSGAHRNRISSIIVTTEAVRRTRDLLTERQRKVAELLETSGARLHGLLARLTLREDIAGDLMQELFIRLLQSKEFERAADPFAYAYRAAMVVLGVCGLAAAAPPCHSFG